MARIRKGLGLDGPSPNHIRHLLFSRWAALAAGLNAFLVYLNTSAPSVTWKNNGADSGDLVTAAFTFGVPHPPGYPLFTLLGSLFARLPTLEPAGGVGLLSALAAAFAVIILARAGDALIAPLVRYWVVAFIPPLLALGFAFGPLLWSQATIAEVYTLNLLIASMILWAMLSDRVERVPLAAAAFGVGMTHHLSILLLAPGAWLALGPVRRVMRNLTVLLAPLLLYAYLPLAALGSPPVNWGNPRTLDGFLWVVTAAPYRSYLLNLSLLDIAARVATTARLLIDQFTPFGVALALWGVIRLAGAQPRRALALGICFALIAAYAVAYASRDSFIYLLPAFAVVLLWAMYGAADVAGLIAGREGAIALVAALAALPAYNLWMNYARMDISSDREAFNFARAIVDRVPRDAVIFADGDEAVFALEYYRHTIAYSDSRAVIVSQGLLAYEWYYDELRDIMSEVTFAPAFQKKDARTRAVEIVNVTFAEGRVVCFDNSSPLLPEFEYETRGNLSCVIAQKSGG